jgi:methylenetetrahydromethanopterin dehydrogenase
MLVKVTFVKIGYIATTTIIDALLDERSGRKDLQMRVVSSSTSMEEDASVDVAKIAAGIPSDLYVVVSPNAAMPGPTKAREALRATGKPIIIVSDEPSRKTLKDNPAEGVGYIVVTNDPMIGAKQSFLDPVEMALFNSDAIKILAVTGSFRIIQQELDKVIEQLGKGEKPALPQVIIEKEAALAAAHISNPYAQGKAIAAFEASRRVAALSTEGTFKVEEPERYLPILAAAHELLRTAAKTADEAREVEKANDTAVRFAHFSKGETRKKTKLSDKFEK